VSRALNDLTPRMRPLAIELIARLVEAGIPVAIIDTLRTREEHLLNIRKGTSGTSLSKHLPLSMRLPKGTKLEGFSEADMEKSDAIDICPWLVFQADGPDKLNWDASHRVWKSVGAIGESIYIGTHTLRWGGRWRKPVDPGHFEFADLSIPGVADKLAEERSRG
jgi:hypothetical protein